MSGIPHPINVNIAIVITSKGIRKLCYLHNTVKHVLSRLDTYMRTQQMDTKFWQKQCGESRIEKNNIKVGFREVCCDYMVWIHLANNRIQGQGILKEAY